MSNMSNDVYDTTRNLVNGINYRLINTSLQTIKQRDLQMIGTEVQNPSTARIQYKTVWIKLEKYIYRRYKKNHNLKLK